MKKLLMGCVLVMILALYVHAAEQEYRVDFSQKIGVVKPVNGINLWARMSNARYDDHQDLMIAGHFSTIRLHDVPWDNPGVRLIDYQHIFGNFKADAKNPDNYYFPPSDDYIKRILDGGAKVIYRLGTSIEHSHPNFYYAKEPKDHTQFAEICAGIIRHYNHGWANGHQWNIQYWEIWNEPNVVPNMWDNNDFSVFCQFYVDVAKRLKKEFPEVKIGGPALAGNNQNLMTQLITTCREQNAPIDFLSWHCYTDDIKTITESSTQMRRLLDDNGFKSSEIHLNEWHYFPSGKWGEIHGREGNAESRQKLRNAPDGMNGIVAASFCAAVLTRWQDTPLTMGNYYAASLVGEVDWGLFNDYGTPFKTYYAFKMFGELITKAPDRVKTTDGNGPISLLGAVGPNNSKFLLISGFKKSLDGIEIHLAGVPKSGKADLLRLDSSCDEKKETLSWSNGLLKIKALPGSSVLLLEFK